MTHNAANERIKRAYFTYLREAKRYHEDTVDQAAQALAQFEADTGFRDFKSFRIEQAVAFKKRLNATVSQATGKPLSAATRLSTLSHLKRFFAWLPGQPGYRSRLNYSDAEYFSFSLKDSRIASARTEREGPTLEQVRHVLSVMPVMTPIDRRNRALIAFTLLTGTRDSATASLKLKHVDLVSREVFQDAREVKTKFSKTFTTFFFPVGDEARQIVEDWIAELRSNLHWGSDDPLFPATAVAFGPSLHFEQAGLKREHWTTAHPIRAVFKQAFTAAGLPYFNPHSFRKTLVRLGQELCRTTEEFKVWSQNLGHEDVMTTLRSYGAVDRRRQAEVMRGFADGAAASDQQYSPEVVKTLMEALSALPQVSDLRRRR